MRAFSPKNAGELLNLGFDFSGSLSANETIVSAVINITVLRGIDAHPESMKVGDNHVMGSVVSQFFGGGVDGVTYLLTCYATTSDSQIIIDEGTLAVESSNQVSALFIKAIDVGQLRQNQMAISGTNINFAALSDDVIWQMMVASEVSLARKLGVNLSPVEIFTDSPTQAELDELNGKSYLIEPGYDFPPNFFGVGKFGAFRLRQVPVVEIKSIKLVYPNTGGVIFDIPVSWVRCDYKYGLVHIFPSATNQALPISIMTMQALTSGIQIPTMIRVRYSAGLTRFSELYPDVVALVKRMTILRIINDAWLPLSESIGADGLSQSQSNDVDKLQKIMFYSLYTLSIQA